jgi:hypothetical protein
MQGSGMLKTLMKNKRFHEEVIKQGGDIARITAGLDNDAIIKEIEEKDAEIRALTENNSNID